MKSLRSAGFASLIFAVLAGAAFCAEAVPQNKALALVGGTIYVSPTEAPIRNGTVIMAGGIITAVGSPGTVHIPANTKTIDCKGLYVAAGFQNSHVHFTETKWNGAGQQPASKLAQQLAEMLTRYGFTSVVDAASTLTNTVALRTRIESGEVAGPRIRTAGLPLYAAHGTPFYLKGAAPDDVIAFIEANLEPTEPNAAVAVVKQDIDGGADIIKLFTGSLASPTNIVPMDQRVANAAAAEAHAHGKLVFAHPSNIEGLEIALKAGVDVAAHTTPASGQWEDALIARMKAQRMSLTPTLKLWIYEASKSGATAEQAQSFADRGVVQLRQYEQADKFSSARMWAT